MKNVLATLFTLSLVFTASVGIVKFRTLDKAARVLMILITVLLIAEVAVELSEYLGQYRIKYVVYNLSAITEMLLQAQFFIYAIKPYRHGKLLLANIIVWPTFWLINIFLLQPITELNTNFMMFESFCTITLSLYFIYWLLRNSAVRNVFKHPHFWVAALWLLLWSVTFFFWVFVKTLYGERWPYINFAMYFQMGINIVVYAGLGFVLLFYPKKTVTNETI